MEQVISGISLTRDFDDFDQYKIEYKSSDFTINFILNEKLLRSLINQFESISSEDVENSRKFLSGEYEWKSHRELGEVPVDELKFGLNKISCQEAKDFRANLVAPLTVPEIWD